MNKPLLRTKTLSTVLLLAAGGVVLPLLSFTGLVSVELVNMLGRYLAFAIVAVGLDLIWGYTGILSLAQSFFFALGGYGMGIYLAFQGTLFNGIPEALYVVYPYAVGEAKGHEVLPWAWLPFQNFGLTVVLCLLVPAVIAGLVGLVGFFSRVKGVYFSILSQALTVAAVLFFSKNEMKFGGTNGLTHFKTIAGLNLSDPNTKILLYLATFFALVGVFYLSRALTRTRFGRVLVAIRDSEKTLRFSGYQPYLFKTAIFAFAGLLAGLGGMLYTPQANIITPSYMDAKWSILMVVWVAVGGRGSLTGAVLGALGVNLLYNALTSQWSVGAFTWSPDYWPIVLGLLFILIVLKFPGGLQGLGVQLKQRVQNRRSS
jgi:urea transport system permease protein